jgi:hypothetical protein
MTQIKNIQKYLINIAYYNITKAEPVKLFAKYYAI